MIRSADPITPVTADRRELMSHDAKKAALQEVVGNAPRRALVVDDEDALSRALSRVLRSAGYEVVVANDGMAAVGALASEGAFDIILSDIQMPGMSGIELMRVVRAYDLDVPVILMTGSPTLETAIEAVSLGALQYMVKPVDFAALLKVAERASTMHQLAKAKRDVIRLLGRDATQAGDRAGLESSFERSLASMWMAFQPIVDAPGKKIFGYEALMRASEPSLPHPGAVLGAAERLDRLFDVGRRVRALSAEAFEAAPGDALLFINLHSRDLLDPLLFEPSAPLSKMARRVVLEITERSSVDDIKDVQARVAALREMGFRIAIDDLGAGYAGLSSFVALEPEIVKLDMSLVRGIHQSMVRQRLVTSMTSLCKDMGMRVVAEGVEDTDERDCMLRIGCDLLQGYLFAKPGRPFPTVESFG
jgi:EAL domain-containing protein (putative c-di-GMP-specific phosphodiesterase class I)